MRKIISREIIRHIPFTALSSFLGILIAIFLLQKFQSPSEWFEIMHPLHILASAIISSAIYYKYKSKFFRALVIGSAVSLLVGTLSDVCLPYISGKILGLSLHFHLPLLHEPLLILLSALAGSTIGITLKLTKLPHFIHVFLSVFASSFYILSAVTDISIMIFLTLVLIVSLVVIVPCCVSDIVLPLLCLSSKKRIQK